MTPKDVARNIIQQMEHGIPVKPYGDVIESHVKEALADARRDALLECWHIARDYSGEDIANAIEALIDSAGGGK